jgi:hypothetical protein
MSNSPDRAHEFRRLLTDLFDGTLTDDDSKQLEQIIETDAVSRAFYRRYLELHAMLQFEDQSAAAGTPDSGVPQSADEFLQYVRRASRQESWQNECVADLASRRKLPILPEMDVSYPGRAAEQPPQSSGLGGGSIQAFGGGAFFLRPWVVFGMIVSSSLIGAIAAFQWTSRPEFVSSIPTIAKDSDSQAGGESNGSTPFAVTLVKVTNCRWDPTRSTADVVSGTVRPGQSLNLLEGVAEVSTALPSGGNGRFQLEGPVSMILTSQGMPNLQYGKMTAEIACGFDRYSLDTPMGRVVVPYSASIGLIVNADEVELHVFDGEAVFEPAWRIEESDPRDSGEAVEQLIVAAGSFIKIGASGDANLRRGNANRALFASQVSMDFNQLEISNQYVSAIRKASPIGYWRFEGEDKEWVRNEMSSKLHCLVIGEGVRWRTYPGNRSIEFGSTTDFGYLLSDDDVDGMIANDYSVELWIKPSHLHQGAIFSLIQEQTRPSQPVGSGLLLETIGPSYAWKSLYPGCLRYLHRCVPRIHTGGTDIHSDVSYEPRKWQYMVATKQGSVMRMYLDGKLVGAEEDTTHLAKGMKVLMGQLYPLSVWRSTVTRPMMGELDEVALYDRALSEEEITKHFRLVRPLEDESQDSSVGEEKRSGADVPAEISDEVRLETSS